MTAIIVNLAGIILILLIIWWFIIAKPKAIQVTSNHIDIRVNKGVYEPAVIKAKKGQALELRFLRLDESPCSEFVIFNELDVSAKLPLNQYHSITIPLEKQGEFEFTCQMGMYRGKLIVD